MCNLYTLESGPDAIRKIFEAAQISLTFPEGIPNFEPRDVRITDRAPIVRFNRDSGEADQDGDKIRRLTIAPLLAEAVRRIADESSVSSLFD